MDEGIQLPVWTKALGWCGIAGLIYLLICAVSIISRGFAGLSADAAHTMFEFAANPWVGLSVGVLGTVLIQSSTTTTAIAVTAVGAGALPIRGAIPVLRPVPLWCAQTIARIAVDRKWVVAAYLITGFIVLPALVILLVGVL